MQYNNSFKEFNKIRTMEGVRIDTRTVPTGGYWGNDVAVKVVDSVKIRLEDFLLAEGYCQMFYTPDGIVEGDFLKREELFRGCMSEAIGYVNGIVPRRHEPVLIDDGGIQVYGFPVLSVVIRDAHGFNSDLHRKMVGLLHEAGVEVVQGYHAQSPAPGTVIYALKRRPDLEESSPLREGIEVPEKDLVGIGG